MRHIKGVMILAVCLMMLGFSVSLLFGIWCMYHEGIQEYKGLQEYVEGESEIETDDLGTVKNTGRIEVDFPALEEINGEIVAWIKCEALGLDYPVVQGSDNEYYLNHTFSGEEHISGCIFMDCLNTSDFTDDNTIFYGHNMKDGSMFGSFNQLTEENAKVFLCTPKETYTYEIIDNRIVDVSEKLYFRIVYGSGEFLELSQMVAEHTGAQLIEGDQLLTLSTCNGDASKRHIILYKRMM